MAKKKISKKVSKSADNKTADRAVKKTAKKVAKKTARKVAAKTAKTVAKKTARKAVAKAARKQTPGKKVQPTAPAPTLELVAKTAYQIYLERLEKGLPGNEESDWLAAEEALRVA